MAKKINKNINDYITKRYERWLDYSLYHCTQAGIKDEAYDVLNEVLCSLLQKNERQLMFLLSNKSGAYTELDFYVLRMIKLNATSETSPYRSRYKDVKKDKTVVYERLEIEDEQYSHDDNSDVVLTQIRTVRRLLEESSLNEKHKRIFEYRFFGESFRSWNGQESTTELYQIYNSVLDYLKQKINGDILF